MDGGPRVAIVTGGSSGIGLAVGRHARGARLRRGAHRPHGRQARGGGHGHRRALGGRRQRRPGGVRGGGGRGRAGWTCSCTPPGSWTGTFVRKESLETFESVLRTNLTSAFVVAHAALPAMPAGGRMVFLSSSSAHAPQPGKSAYSASKAGLNVFAGALAKEVERDGIAVHVVTTGPVATPMLDDVHFPMRTLGVRRRGPGRRVARHAAAATSCCPSSRCRRWTRARSPRRRSCPRPPGSSAGPSYPAPDRARRRDQSSAPPPSTTSTTAAPTTAPRSWSRRRPSALLVAGRRRGRCVVVVVAAGSDRPDHG